MLPGFFVNACMISQILFADHMLVTFALSSH